MRNVVKYAAWIVIVLAALALWSCAARAQSCLPITDADKFIMQGVTSIESGETKGVAVVGNRAVALAKAAELPPQIVAFFFVNDAEMVIVVVNSPDGSAMACVGEPSASLKSAYQKFIGRGA